jgi:hypothetical protein
MRREIVLGLNDPSSGKAVLSMVELSELDAGPPWSSAECPPLPELAASALR